MRCCIIVMQPRQRGRCVCSNLISFDLCPIISRGFLTTPLSLCLVVSFSLSCSLFFSVSLSLSFPSCSRAISLSLSLFRRIHYSTGVYRHTQTRARDTGYDFFANPNPKYCFRSFIIYLRFGFLRIYDVISSLNEFQRF